VFDSVHPYEIIIKKTTKITINKTIARAIERPVPAEHESFED
jgi:hypothetical protein